MGIKGTVRRTTDGHLIHANIDTDIIISEEPPTGSTKKPEELYHVIERFAQGTAFSEVCHDVVVQEPRSSCTPMSEASMNHNVAGNSAFHCTWQMLAGKKLISVGPFFCQ